jgi:predicted permease
MMSIRTVGTGTFMVSIYLCMRRGAKRGVRCLASVQTEAVIATMACFLTACVLASVSALVKAVVVDPLPIRDIARLVLIREELEGTPDRSRFAIPGGPRLSALRPYVNSIEGIAAVVAVSRAGSRSTGRPQMLHVGSVTADFFDVVGADMACGSGRFASGSATAVGRGVVLSFRLASALHGSPTSACGKSIELEQRTYRVLGVLPQAFEWDYSAQVDAWTAATPRELQDGTAVAAVGRLREGRDLTEAVTELEGIGSRVAREHPTDGGRGVRTMYCVPYSETLMGDSVRLVGAIAAIIPLVWLAAATNLTLLHVLRLANAADTFLIGHALGAQWYDGVVEQVAETMVYTAVGVAAALCVADQLIGYVALAMPDSIARAREAQLGVEVAGFSLLATTGLVVAGLVPSVVVGLRLQRTGSCLVGHGGDRGLWNPAVANWSCGFQAALVLVATTVALMVGVSLYHTRTRELGFNPTNVHSYALMPSGHDYKDAADFGRYAHNVLSRVSRIPGVQSASVASSLPLRGAAPRIRLRVPNDPGTPEGPVRTAAWRGVSDDYFRTLGIPIVAGRPLRRDSQSGPPEAVINGLLAKALWGGATAVGRDISVVGDFAQKILGASELRVVGVSGDTLVRGLAPAKPEIYLPLTASPLRGGTLLVKARADSGAMGHVEQSIMDADPHQFLDRADPGSLQAQVDDVLAIPSLLTSSMAIVAGAVGMMALYGLWAVVSVAFTRRSQELAIRRALGASPSHVVVTIALPAVVAVMAGVAGGTVFMIWLGPLIGGGLGLSVSYGLQIQIEAVLLVVLPAAVAVAWPLVRCVNRVPWEMLKAQ